VSLNVSVGWFPSLDVLKCRDKNVFDLVNNVRRKCAVVPHDLLKSSKRVVSQGVTIQGIKIVRDVIPHDVFSS
jgi:hypothetical protein